jgi:hypothetical protein
MNKTFVLFLAFVVVVSAGMGISAAADANDVGNITVGSDNQNLQDQELISEQTLHDPKDPKKIPMQKTGVPVMPALLSTLLIGSGLIYERLRK